MADTNNIFLIGMMGSGKSSVAKELAKKLNMKSCDIDDDIESLTELTITEIFSKYGEKRFREMESIYFIEKSKQNGTIFSTGGGIILNDKCREILINNGLTFFLDAPVNILAERLKKLSNRPLLIKKNKKVPISKYYNDRIDHYRNCSNHIIQTENSNPKSIADKIIEYYNG